MTQTVSYSLRRRLLLSTGLLLIVFLGLMGLVLNKAFQDSVMSNAENALRGHLLLIMSNIEIEQGKVIMPSRLPEARFGQLNSGLFAQITDAEDHVLWQSNSLLSERLPALDTQLGVFDFTAKATWVDHPEIVAMTLGVEWETEQAELPLRLQVAEHTRPYLAQLANYQQRLFVWLVMLGVLLLLLLLSLMRWILQPLSKVMSQVTDIEQGTRHRLDEDYPKEVNKLAASVNQLINYEEARIQRHQQVLGNLAHSLKTPLAVLKNISTQSADNDEMTMQLNAMHNIIEYQLQNASAVGCRHFAKPIDIVEPTQQLVSSLHKLHKDKQIQVDLIIDPEVRFYGDRGDWMELLGNLLENAFKWTQSNIEVTVTNPAKTNQARQSINIEVADDGKGIEESLKQTILQRGVRLDNQAPGHGLGLHIVKSIVEAYNGEMEIDDNKPQGTRFIITLN